MGTTLGSDESSSKMSNARPIFTSSFGQMSGQNVNPKYKSTYWPLQRIRLMPAISCNLSGQKSSECHSLEVRICDGLSVSINKLPWSSEEGLSYRLYFRVGCEIR